MNITTQQAVNQLVNALKEDNDYYESWKANIAMSFKDEFSRRFPNGTDQPIHEISNCAADNFLKLLMR